MTDWGVARRPKSPPSAEGGLGGLPLASPSTNGLPCPRPIATPGYAGVLDSGLRRNDGEDGLPTYRHSRPLLRHSRESGNPHPGLSPRRNDGDGRWAAMLAGLIESGFVDAYNVGVNAAGVPGAQRRPAPAIAQSLSGPPP